MYLVSAIFIRKFQDSDYNDVLNISYKTGYMGNDLNGTGEFDDVKLFGYFFCIYYLIYEKEHCFVAVDKDNNYKVIGYIIGTLNTKVQQHLFLRKMILKISRRMIYTLFRYPKTLKNILNMSKNKSWKFLPKNFYDNYPVHFHINIISGYQGKGIGNLLLGRFEQHVQENGGTGIHLKTSNKNCKAIRFYQKRGYTKFLEFDDTLWKSVDDYKTIIFVKSL